MGGSNQDIFCYLLFLLMTAGCLRYTLADKTISATTLFGSLSAYLFIGLAYAYLDLFVYMLDPGAFLGLVGMTENTMIYYSFVTLTTLGFGDIVPKSPIAQTLSWFESFTGQAYLAVLMGQLVGRYVADRLLHKK
ncbi:potassium channel family protein [Legionella tunisiensis]|uniref:potassium channel family protein n=1 Tax=Legionella tunisiensis TaxID=1034944 RepID=UPI00031E1660|nr:potassium channel family protein [Legionella tunisiensis]